MGFDIDDVMNAIGLPKVNLSDLAKKVDELEGLLKKSKSGNRLDELNGELKSIADNMGLAKLDVTEAKNILEELKAMKKSSVHDSYHSVYSSDIQKRMRRMKSDFEKLTAKVGKNQAKSLIKHEFDAYLGNLYYKLTVGEIKL